MPYTPAVGMGGGALRAMAVGGADSARGSAALPLVCGVGEEGGGRPRSDCLLQVIPN